MGVTLINDTLPGEAIDVPPESVVHWRRSGWHKPGEDGPDGAELASYQSADPTPADMRPKTVTIFHPVSGGTAEVPESAVAPFRGAGWVTRAEWDENQAAVTQDDDEPAKDDGPVTPARSGTPTTKAGSASVAAGATDKE